MIPVPIYAKYSVRKKGNRWALIVKFDGCEYVMQHFDTKKAAMAARIL